MTARQPPGRIAGIDYGTVRIGVAVADVELSIASPCENYTRVGTDADAKHFRQLVEDQQITRFVVGLPVHLDGRESRMAAAARTFGAWLGEVTGVPVEWFDERFSSVEASETLSQARLTSKKRRARRDMLAAQIMLAAYLESHTADGSSPPPIDG